MTQQNGNLKLAYILTGCDGWIEQKDDEEDTWDRVPKNWQKEETLRRIAIRCNVMFAQDDVNEDAVDEDGSDEESGASSFSFENEDENEINLCDSDDSDDDSGGAATATASALSPSRKQNKRQLEDAAAVEPQPKKQKQPGQPLLTSFFGRKQPRTLMSFFSVRK